MKPDEVVGPARFERATLCLEGRCSIHLSYGPVLLILSVEAFIRGQILLYSKHFCSAVKCNKRGCSVK
jgi:hypothetical protein